MSYITLWTITVPASLVTGLLAVLGTGLILSRHSKKTYSLDPLWDTVFWHVLIWKGSYVIMYWETVVSSPLSVLYFDGGLTGAILATVVSVALLFWKHTEQGKLSVYIRAYLGVFTLYQWVEFILDGYSIGMLLVLIAQSGLLAWYLRRKHPTMIESRQTIVLYMAFLLWMETVKLTSTPAELPVALLYGVGLLLCTLRRKETTSI
ncbi:hypothetical protein [Bacillus fonticola]|uniref:hypothetical protein n=1 Tax=Bacillus fonticola TaxID=2728853 RepID=UPI0014748E58|nr:hypothetical protein [Bacillus fonticola]